MEEAKQTFDEFVKLGNAIQTWPNFELRFQNKHVLNLLNIAILVSLLFYYMIMHVH